MPTTEDLAQALDVRVRDVNFLVRRGLFPGAPEVTPEELELAWENRSLLLGVLAQRGKLGNKDLSPLRKSWKPYSDGTVVKEVTDARVAQQGASEATPGASTSKQRSPKKEPSPKQAAKRERQRQEALARKEAAARRERVVQGVRVAVRERKQAPAAVLAHLGPTNSGKTHDSLLRLAQEGAGTYAAPLRMLAMEAYEKLSALVGEGNVGLLTGEEQVNPGAPLICATAEMAPMSGKVLVVDEVQWVADRDRGWAWTRLLAGSDYEEVHLCGAPEAEALLRRAYSDAGHFELVAHERLEALELKGAVTLKQVPDNSVVVAFSRKAVLALARQLGRDGRRAAVLYGALPPVARRAELERFISGEASVMVATDVIGHGVNMPAKAVVMAETTKYDGFGRRPLEVWEAAQIVGRAGRHGLAGAGSVHVLTGVTGFTADPQLVRRAVEATTGLRAARPDLTTGELRPTLGDLGVEHPGDFLVALDAWFAKARRALADHPWLRPLDVTSLLERAGVLEECFADAGLEWPITADEAWSLLRMPVDHTRKDSLFELLVLAVGGEPSPLQGLLERARKRLPSGTQEDLEVAAGQFRDLRAFATSFPENAVITAEEARLLEEEAGTLLVKRMDKAVSANSYGVCSGCGKPCAPWFTSCQSCHQGSYRGYGRGHRESWYDEFDD